MKNQLTPDDKKTLKLLGYVKTQEDGAQLEHPCMSDLATFPKYVWTGDTLKDVLKNFTAGIQYGAISEAARSLKSMKYRLREEVQYGNK
jgi:hypothetical protein